MSLTIKERCVKSRILYLSPDRDQDYTSAPTHVRVYMEEHGDEYPWVVDGADDEGNYTEECWRYRTQAEAFAAVPEFVAMLNTNVPPPPWRTTTVTGKD